MTMTRIVSSAVLCSLLAGCSSGWTNEDLDGTWVGRDHTINSRGRSVTRKEIVLAVDRDGLIEGTTTWTLLDGEGGHAGDAPSRSDSEQVYGAFDSEDGTFYLVETEESGFWHGRLVAPDAIRCFLVQPGEKPVSAFVELTKQP